MTNFGRIPGFASTAGRARAMRTLISAAALAGLMFALLSTGVASGTLEPAMAASCKQERLGARVLKIGHCGEDVRALNWFLHAKKLSVKMNGNFRSPTRSAVRKFQGSAGLQRDGIVGAQTVGKIKKRMSGGKSSWYGPGFWGNRTACGQNLKKSTVGVAVPAEKIKRFPCGTKVLLNHGGRWVRARVIDTGGFAKYGRKWDLTERTAKRLNSKYKSEGVFNVRSIVRAK